MPLSEGESRSSQACRPSNEPPVSVRPNNLVECDSDNYSKLLETPDEFDRAFEWWKKHAKDYPKTYKILKQIGMKTPDF